MKKKPATKNEKIFSVFFFIGLVMWMNSSPTPTKKTVETKKTEKIEKTERFAELLKKEKAMTKSALKRAKAPKKVKRVVKKKSTATSSWDAKVKCMSVLKMKLKGFKVGRIFKTLQLKTHTRQSVEMISKKHTWIKATFTCKFFKNGKFSVKKQNL